MTKKSHPECPVPAGSLIVIGGKENKGGEEAEGRKSPNGFAPMEILERFVKLSDKPHPIIEVVTSASGNGEESFEEYKKVFEQLGVKEVSHIHHTNRQEAMGKEAMGKMEKADAFFFSGGDQLLLTSLYGGTPFLTELKKRYIYENIVIGGTSAGAMALSTPMIYAGNEEVQQISGEIKVTTGLEFLKDVCIDTHFVHRSRFVRLAQVISTNPMCIGIGVEEDTAFVIHDGQEGEVIGSGVVIIVSGFHIEASNIKDFSQKKTLSIRNLKVDILASGNRFVIPRTNPQHV
ncbi:MAG: cyanophycinase [Williamsia sp.]|nr:cyanophycinase [Williamsia sp.]